MIRLIEPKLLPLAALLAPTAALAGLDTVPEGTAQVVACGRAEDGVKLGLLSPTIAGLELREPVVLAMGGSDQVLGSRITLDRGALAMKAAEWGYRMQDGVPVAGESTTVRLVPLEGDQVEVGLPWDQPAPPVLAMLDLDEPGCFLWDDGYPIMQRMTADTRLTHLYGEAGDAADALKMGTDLVAARPGRRPTPRSTTLPVKVMRYDTTQAPGVPDDAVDLSNRSLASVCDPWLPGVLVADTTYGSAVWCPSEDAEADVAARVQQERRLLGEEPSVVSGILQLKAVPETAYVPYVAAADDGVIYATRPEIIREVLLDRGDRWHPPGRIDGVIHAITEDREMTVVLTGAGLRVDMWSESTGQQTVARLVGEAYASVTPDSNPFRRACDMGRYASCGRAAQWVWETRKDREQSMELSQRGCDGGDAMACVLRGWLELSEDPQDDEMAAAVPWFERGCAMDDALACRVLAQSLFVGPGARDLDGAAMAAQRGCSLGDADACGLHAAVLREQGTAIDSPELEGMITSSCVKEGRRVDCANGAEWAILRGRTGLARQFALFGEQRGEDPDYNAFVIDLLRLRWCATPACTQAALDAWDAMGPEARITWSWDGYLESLDEHPDGALHRAVIEASRVEERDDEARAALESALTDLAQGRTDTQDALPVARLTREVPASGPRDLVLSQAYVDNGWPICHARITVGPDGRVLEHDLEECPVEHRSDARKWLDDTRWRVSDQPEAKAWRAWIVTP